MAASSPREARDRPITILCFFLTDQGERAVRAVRAGGTSGAEGGGGARVLSAAHVARGCVAESCGITHAEAGCVRIATGDVATAQEVGSRM